MPWHQTGATQYHAQFGLPDNGRAIKWLVVRNCCDLEPLDLLNCLTCKHVDTAYSAIKNGIERQVH